MSRYAKPLSNVCHCCGQPVPQQRFHWDKESCILTYNGQSIKLTDLQAKMFDLHLRYKKLGSIVTRERLINVLYADREDGGPKALNAVYAIRKLLNLRIRPMGLAIHKGQLVEL